MPFVGHSIKGTAKHLYLGVLVLRHRNSAVPQRLYLDVPALRCIKKIAAPKCLCLDVAAIRRIQVAARKRSHNKIVVPKFLCLDMPALGHIRISGWMCTPLGTAKLLCLNFCTSLRLSSGTATEREKERRKERRKGRTGIQCAVR